MGSTSHRGAVETVDASLRVMGIAREITVKIATVPKEWEAAFGLVAERYRSLGYLPSSGGDLYFTPYLALPDVVTVVARHEGRVVATMSGVVDNVLLGLPMDCIYAAEIDALRRSGRRVGEATCLADAGLGRDEFVPVFLALIKVAMQWHARQGGNTIVISVNPRHRSFYQRVLGFVPLGPRRPYPSVQDAPAEAYWLDWDLMRANATACYREILGLPLPPDLLAPVGIPRSQVRELCRRAVQSCVSEVDQLCESLDACQHPRRW